MPPKRVQPQVFVSVIPPRYRRPYRLLLARVFSATDTARLVRLDSHRSSGPGQGTPEQCSPGSLICIAPSRARPWRRRHPCSSSWWGRRHRRRRQNSGALYPGTVARVGHPSLQTVSRVSTLRCVDRRRCTSGNGGLQLTIQSGASLRTRHPPESPDLAHCHCS